MTKPAKGQHRATGGSTPAVTALVRAGVVHRVHAYDHDPAAASYGLEAAQALGVEPQRVFKTLVAKVDDTLVVGLVPVSGELDLKALARASGGRRATMADPATAQRATGYVLGGISPLGQKRTHRTVLDESALGFSTILVSAGRRGLELELDPRDLLVCTSGCAAAIAG